MAVRYAPSRQTDSNDLPGVFRPTRAIHRACHVPVRVRAFGSRPRRPRCEIHADIRPGSQEDPKLTSKHVFIKCPTQISPWQLTEDETSDVQQCTVCLPSFPKLLAAKKTTRSIAATKTGIFRDRLRIPPSSAVCAQNQIPSTASSRCSVQLRDLETIVSITTERSRIGNTCNKTVSLAQRL